MSAINLLLLGAVAMASLVAALFFLRFWKRTHDRFFLLFSIAFAIDAADRMAIGLYESKESDPIFYVIRLFVFGVILAAIIDKNWTNKRDA